VFARFFIDRPIFAWVITIVIVLAGVASALTLPIAQYPEITPPSVQVTCQYAGASARVVADTVAAPIEQQVVGVENMLYMSSQSSNDGSYTLTVTFALGTDLNTAQVLVQNRVQQAIASLPDQVKATGVVVTKQSPSILLVVNLYSEINPETKQPYFDQRRLSNYATIQVRDELSRLKGVGNVNYLGQQDYSMRVWMDPEKLASRDLTADDVVRVLKEQNVQVAAGQLARPPIPTSEAFQFTMTTLGRLVDAEQFGDIVLKTGSTGQVTRLKDIGRVELGSKTMDTRCRLDGQASTGLAIYQLPGSNALDTAQRVKDKMKELARRFPVGLKYAIVYDTTPFVRESVAEVFKTLRDAIILVALVVLLFLQDWKAVILPLIDVTVSLVGTLAVMKLMGFSLNNLTLFGLVLAIGIVVDDAIVVLENIEVWLARGLSVREATIKGMDEITGPIMGITLVLSSVFLPSALIPGISGQFYRQFALTIAVSMMISAVNAMTLTPARATSVFTERKSGNDGAEGHATHEALPRWGIALLAGYLLYRFVEPLLTPMLGLTPPAEGAVPDRTHELLAWGLTAGLFVAGAAAGWLIGPGVNKVLGALFRSFNRLFEWLTAGYAALVRRLLRFSGVVLLVYAGLLALTYYGFTRVPVGFIPIQDKGYLIVNVTLPDAASLDRTEAVVRQIERIARKTEGVGHTVSVPGMAVVLNGAISSNFATLFVVLQPFEERHGKHGAEEVAAALRQHCRDEIDEAEVAVFQAPPVDGLGSAGGFKVMIEDRGDLGLGKLQDQADQFAHDANEGGELVGVFNSLRTRTPQFYIDIDRVKCKMLGVELSAVFDALSMYMGGYYVNDFNRFGRTWQVNVQAEGRFRLSPDALRLMTVRNRDGRAVPLATVAKVRISHGPVMVTRYNTFPAATINGGARVGVSTGTVIDKVEGLARDQLPDDLVSEWTELTFMQKEAGSAAVFAFVGAVVLVFLVLAAQYESWSLPMAIILVVPMCLLCAVAGVAMAKMDINIFVQVGFVVLVGLASKNAILVVEVARDRQAAGMPRLEATVEACRSRLRPIIMTSLAFILGVFPLVVAQGAGAEMRRTLGTAVFAGTFGVTMFGIFLTPVFYYVIMGLVERGKSTSGTTPVPAAPHPAAVEAIQPADGRELVKPPEPHT
jgi:multidrug efflux pump subunit AcrB